MKATTLLFLSSLFLVLIGCRDGAKKSSIKDNYKARIFQTEISEFGYDIYKDSTLIIHQPSIPGVQGNKGFSTRENAEKVSALMIFKLDHGIAPPSISLKELDSLKIK
jgi:Domain of unknown function (DUF4907)